MSVVKLCEETLYLNMMKSIVTGFDEFLSNIDKYDIILSDEFLLSSLRKVGTSLQRIINKWDRLEKKSKQKCEDNITSFENKKREKPFSALDLSIIYPKPKINTTNNNESIFIDEVSFEKKNEHENKKKEDLDTDVQHNYPQFVKKVLKVAKMHCEDTGSEQESDSDEMNGELNIECSATHKKEKLKTSSTDKNYIIKIKANVYACKICKINHLSKSNLDTHKQGKQHKNNKKKLEMQENRDLSSTKPTIYL